LYVRASPVYISGYVPYMVSIASNAWRFYIQVCALCGHVTLKMTYTDVELADFGETWENCLKSYKGINRKITIIFCVLDCGSHWSTI